MRRYELTDEQWALIEPLLPPRQGNGRPYRDHRTMLNAWFWILGTGSSWRDLPDRFGPWKTAYNRFKRWRREGLMDRILEALQIHLDEDGQIDWDLSAVRSRRMSRPLEPGKRGIPRAR